MILSLDIVIKITFSVLFGGLIGVERERSDKPAGLRTVMLVTLSATIFTIIALSYPAIIGKVIDETVRYDIGRIIAYTIAGMGFLGGGIIMKRGNSVEGITTASVLWMMVGIGILSGLGFFHLAAFVVFIIFGILKLKYLEDKLIHKESEK